MNTETTQKINQMRALAGSIAHEMRNPLNACYGCIDMLSDSIDSSQETLNLMRQEIDRANQLIGIILRNINDKPIDKSEFKSLSIRRCVEQAIKEYAFGPNEREKVSVNGDDFEFIGSETLIIYTLFNLLKNALYYLHVRKDGRLTIRIEPENKHLIIEDNGPGIPTAKISHIFDSFQTHGKASGTGLCVIWFYD